MQEWLNWHAWKACEPLKGSGGSNPFLSAIRSPVGLNLQGFFCKIQETIESVFLFRKLRGKYGEIVRCYLNRSY